MSTVVVSDADLRNRVHLRRLDLSRGASRRGEASHTSHFDHRKQASTTTDLKDIPLRPLKQVDAGLVEREAPALRSVLAEQGQEGAGVCTGAREIRGDRDDLKYGSQGTQRATRNCSDEKG